MCDGKSAKLPRLVTALLLHQIYFSFHLHPQKGQGFPAIAQDNTWLRCQDDYILFKVSLRIEQYMRAADDPLIMHANFQTPVSLHYSA